MDDDYIYYLDKQSVSWQRLPYSASEYMLDVWIRIIERHPDISNLTDDEFLSIYINDKDNGEVKILNEQGIVLESSDIEVLNHKKYSLEHYYIRPKTKQIQFLSALEVMGLPKNKIAERTYDYKNWENLTPGSKETLIYYGVIKNIGTKGATESGHMNFADYLEEYARISIR